MTLSLSGGEKISLGAAQKSERNILARLQRAPATDELNHGLWRERLAIEAVTAHHLGLANPTSCTVQGVGEWMKGQFNICVLVHVRGPDGGLSKVVFRCSMPHKVGEQHTPGAVDEKVRAEAATYGWMEENCPDIPIARLHAFGLANGLQFVHRAHGVGHVRDTSAPTFRRPYLLQEYIDTDKGRMLSDTLCDFRETDPERMINLFRGISRLMLSLAARTQPRIGALRFNDDASISLTSRPLFCAHAILESEGAPRVLDRTYTTCGGLIDAMLRFREEAFRAQPNAVNDEEDCHLQMLHMVLLRLLQPQFVDSESDGPFVLQFTDFHASNIFVDDAWNIVALIDLEFVCALPPCMLHVPHWLAVDAIDDIRDEMAVFSRMHRDFMAQFEDVEAGTEREHSIPLSSSIREALSSGACWFYLCLTSINGMQCFLEDHLYEKFDVQLSADEERRWASLMSRFWAPDAKEIVARKLGDKAKYDADLALHFDGNSASG